MGLLRLVKFWRLQFLLIMLVCFVMEISSAISSDGGALLSLKSTIVGSDGIFLQWRQEDTDPCDWKGVTCDTQTKRVIYLSLAYHKLIGSISPEIGKLSHLKLLSLQGNSLYGTIPPDLGNCNDLQYLYLQGNYLSGFIPMEFGNLLELEALDISSNTLSGSIPESLGNLTKLKSFNVSTNFLTGIIPSDGSLFRFTENSFVGNRGLCGKQIGIVCKDHAQPPSGDSKLSPEYMLSGRATEKTDVYSFGVLVLEVISGKRPTDSSFIEKGLNIVGWLNFLVAENHQRELIDLHCEVQTESLDALLSVAIQCVSSSPEDRPTMHRVLQILESEVMTPCPSDFYDSNSDCC